MHLEINKQTKILSLITIVVLTMSSLFVATALSLQITTTSEYTNSVHTYVNSPQGNYTYLEKPMFPVLINSSQIAIGQNWTIIAPLQTSHNYHIYCYGAWINTSAQAKTDYDFYVYDPQGNLVSSHTESAGFPPHLGTTTDNPFFTPTQSGNYSFVIKNSQIDSQGAQQATFMIIENLQPDQWYTSYIEGRNDYNSSKFTSWAYEFVTNATNVNLYLQVPETLDVYEARLYLMNNAQSPTLTSFPLPWEAGLYGNLSNSVGGYNFDSTGYRGVSYASCEHNGQAMFLNYTSSSSGLNLYHLVLIGEQGSGNIELMMKTTFENLTLTPLTVPIRVYPNNSTEIALTSNNTLDRAQVSYTDNNWTSINTIDMQISNRTINATIPGQKAGSLILYQVNAVDILKNSMAASGNYTVKEPLTINITAVKDKIQIGENITITGALTPHCNDSVVQVKFFDANTTKTINSEISSNGAFMASFKPISSGSWAVTATSPETQTSYRCDSQPLTVKVTEPPVYVKYSLFIIIGLISALAAGGAVYFLKFREK